jgi:hypothetical protein
MLVDLAAGIEPMPRQGTEMLTVMAQNQAGQRFMAFGYQQNYQQPPCPLSRWKLTSFVPIVRSAFGPIRDNCTPPWSLEKGSRA